MNTLLILPSSNLPPPISESPLREYPLLNPVIWLRMCGVVHEFTCSSIGLVLVLMISLSFADGPEAAGHVFRWF